MNNIINNIHIYDTKDMTLENYIKFYNETIYPLNYPYYLRIGLRSKDNRNSLIVQIAIPIEEEDYFDIDEPTKYEFQDILTINGESDEEIINMFKEIEFSIDHKEYFKKLWNK